MTEAGPKSGLFIIDNTYFSPEPQVWKVIREENGEVSAVGISGYFDDGRGPTGSIEGFQKTFNSRLVDRLQSEQPEP